MNHLIYVGSKMTDKNQETNYVCATPVIVNKNGKVIIGESTIIRPEKDLIIVKKQTRGNK